MEQVIYLNAGRQESATNRAKAVIGALAGDKAWRITIAEIRSKRTHEQNSLLWAIYADIIRIGGEAMQGHTKEELHEFFLGDWSGWEIKPIFGKKKQVPKRRSSRLNKQEFSDFVEHILRFMAERGVYIKTPL